MFILKVSTNLKNLQKCEFSGTEKNRIAVSYTHLDVYKRQTECILVIAMYVKLWNWRSSWLQWKKNHGCYKQKTKAKDKCAAALSVVWAII